MLENLFIKNVALIKEENVDFTNGLNIISGESGSGKSMLIDSINFVLGDKIKKDFIRHSEEEASVVATFYVENSETVELIKGLDIEVLEDNQVQIKRTINTKNKTTIKINERTVTLSVLRQISNFLVDIHLQKDNLEILKKSTHIDFLDLVCKDELANYKSELKILVTEYKQITDTINNLLKSEQENIRKLDILNFEFEELEKANLVIDEDTELTARQKLLANTEKISNNSEEIVSLLYNANDDEYSAYDKITSAISLLEEFEDVSQEFKKLKESLIDAQINIEDVALVIKDYSNDINDSGLELKEVDDRLSLLFRLKKKYGKTIEELIKYKEEIEEEIYTLNNSDKIVLKLQVKAKELNEKCISICKEITKIRKKYIKPVTSTVINTLKDLGMVDVLFEIKINNKEEFNENGIDEVAFYISTNKGQELKPLEKIVSGGEMSRIMIAIKNLISDNYQIETFIFDEIDTGVSGRTAQKVGEKLVEISSKHQIICITHLPQIASLGNNNLLIYKESLEKETVTNIEKLDIDGKTVEIARLIGGKKITDETLNYAKELVKMAGSI